MSVFVGKSVNRGIWLSDRLMSNELIDAAHNYLDRYKLVTFYHLSRDWLQQMAPLNRSAELQMAFVIGKFHDIYVSQQICFQNDVSKIIEEASVPIMSQLNEHDLAVLNGIFNPLLPLGEAICPVGTDNDGELRSEEDAKPEVIGTVKQAILAAEARDFEEAFRLFQQALNEVPNSPAILNDRAQAYRLAGRNEEAMNDLNLAVELNGGKGKAGIQALCQRGILYQSLGKIDEAREDFTVAANGGSSFARTQLVALNPYAAMCNCMLRDIAKTQYNLS